MGTTYIAKDIKKTSDRIDGMTGNIINPRTKEIITPVEPVFVPPTTPPEAPQQPTAQEEPKPGVCQVEVNTLSIPEQIKQAKENLKQLEELKQLKIKELKAQAELLEKE
jgi:hypothetical protein